ncbi:MAG: ferrous iron transport protein B [Intestinibacillus sp.]
MVDSGLRIQKTGERDFVIALAGNPNVGKSTVFNALTGMNQHTGNWAGKTVASAQGIVYRDGRHYILVDLPGTYSLMAHSAEEEVARDFLCFGKPDCTVVVVDATCLERNLNLVLQTTEITSRTVVCVNLMDEAEKKGILLNLPLLSEQLGVPVVPCAAREGRGLDTLLETIGAVADGKRCCAPPPIRYLPAVEEAVARIEAVLPPTVPLNPHWLALRLLEGDSAFLHSLTEHVPIEIPYDVLSDARSLLLQNHIEGDALCDLLVAGLVLHAEEIACDVIQEQSSAAAMRDRAIDRILTSRQTGIPIMLLLLLGIFFLTIQGANYPSALLNTLLSSLDAPFIAALQGLGAPVWLQSLLVEGVWRVLATVVSVMLPPMAIFFPLFTLLEDLGYLPRVAFNLDHYFKKAKTCGKQALTLCMGFGCNAAGVVGCRIIDSPRERLIAILTNNFVPCNGRFPTLIAILTMFFAGGAAGFFSSALSAFLLTLVIVFCVLMTLLVSRILSSTILKGIPSSFTLELPPYRMPQIGKVIVRSVFDRTLFVLGRAIVVAAPAGLVIWLLANITVGDASLLTHCAAFLDPFARLFGLDGVILLAFILGFPANEIVMPLILMGYLSSGTLSDIPSLSEFHTLLVAHGWTAVTAVCTMLFSLLHWPCSTTCLTVRKEAGSLKWTAAAFIIPTALGLLVCFIVATGARLLGIG